jgi:hypothetical protein
MSVDFYTEALKKILLHDVTIHYGNSKSVKSGQIKNFDIKQFHIRLCIKNTKNLTKTIEFPYPFKMELSDDSITLNYKLSSFYKNEDELSFKIKTLSRKTSNKLYDNIVYIKMNKKY